MKTFLRCCEDVGLARVHSQLNISELFAQLGPGDELLWLDSYSPSDGEFMRNIRPAIERGAKIKMLIMDPRCINHGLRADEIRENDTFAKDIEVCVRRVSSIRCSLKNCGLKEESCQILVHEDLPCTQMYIVTHHGIPVRGVSRFCLAKPSAYFTHLEWTAINGGVLENLHGYFQEKWESNLQRMKQSFQSFELLARAPERRSNSYEKGAGSLRTTMNLAM